MNTLGKILPDICKAIGIPVKTPHCLSVSCATALFQQGVEEKANTRENRSQLSLMRCLDKRKRAKSKRLK